MRAGRYWIRLSRFLMTAASWSTSRTARLPRPFFMFAQAPSAAFRSGGVSRQPHLGQPVRVGADEPPHHAADVGVEVIPDQGSTGACSSGARRRSGRRNRLRTSSGARPCARGGCGPGRTGGSAPPGRRHTSPATDTRPEPFPQTVTTGVCPRRPQVRAFGGRRFCPASSSKTIHAPVAAASLVPSPRSRPRLPRSSPHRAPQPGAPGPAGCTRGGAAGTRSRAACTAHGTAGRSAW